MVLLSALFDTDVFGADAFTLNQFHSIFVVVKYDLRTNKCMPAIKNQGKCGCCWAFATTTPIEYQKCVKTGKLVTLRYNLELKRTLIQVSALNINRRAK